MRSRSKYCDEFAAAAAARKRNFHFTSRELAPMKEKTLLSEHTHESFKYKNCERVREEKNLNNSQIHI